MSKKTVLEAMAALMVVGFILFQRMSIIPQFDAYCGHENNACFYNFINWYNFADKVSYTSWILAAVIFAAINLRHWRIYAIIGLLAAIGQFVPWQFWNFLFPEWIADGLYYNARQIALYGSLCVFVLVTFAKGIPQRWWRYLVAPK